MNQSFIDRLKNAPPVAFYAIASIGVLFLAGVVWYSISGYSSLEQEKINILTDLREAREKNYDLFQQNIDQREVINSFQGQIQNISSTVGNLEKLSQTDEELLRKYSKIYFLNENYVPAKLAEIPEEYRYKDSTNYLIHADVWPYLEKLLKAAHKDDIDLLTASAFRSFDTQASLKAGYKVTYGAGTANQFSADQGYSEHQLGTSLDFTTSKVGGNFSDFKDDPAYDWLLSNAYKYGFVLSYPKDNTYYKFEPWHWRFVGVALADFLHKENKYFYDLEQRQIDPYLIKLFD